MWAHVPLTTFELASLIVSIVGLAAITWQIRYSARQATVFADFSKRYAEIDDRFPNASGHYRTSDLTTDQKKAYFIYLEQYLDLLHQEYELHRRGMIDRAIWNIWAEYARAHVRGHHFQEFWQSDQGKVAFNPNPRFSSFLEGLKT
jgi:hypothetical protein